MCNKWNEGGKMKANETIIFVHIIPSMKSNTLDIIYFYGSYTYVTEFLYEDPYLWAYVPKIMSHMNRKTT